MLFPFIFIRVGLITAKNFQVLIISMQCVSAPK